MGAFFAGAIRAPITSILIIFEMTGDYAIILPLMICNVISYTVAVRLQPVPIYDALLRQDGVPMPEHDTRRDLRAVAVEQAMRAASGSAFPGAAVLFPDQSLDLALLVLGRHSLREAQVVSRSDPHQVLGALSLEDIAAAVNRS
jgi:CIC family chloride channel protein